MTEAVLYAGVMSGTSTDGLDAVLLEVGPQARPLRVVSHLFHPFAPALRSRLLALQNLQTDFEGLDPFVEYMLARRDLSDACVQIVQELLGQTSVSRDEVRAAGLHGQTIRHRPDLEQTLQMIDASRAAKRLGIRVVADFRSADVALGGQGAPLACGFHRAWVETHGLRKPGSGLGVLNLGGFSNLTVLGDGPVTGGDCGPANVYLDWWAQTEFGCPFDRDGETAAGGRLSEALFAQLCQHPFFAQPWPASTGRDDFNLEWIESVLSGFRDLQPEDVMRTLLEWSAWCVAQHVESAGLERLAVCGGGARNSVLMRRLSELSNVPAEPMSRLGLAEETVEAAAFAWLAACFDANIPAHELAVTGARKPTVLGGLYLP